jgi:hypothetical protein
MMENHPIFKHAAAKKCIADPRLCDIRVFERYFSTIKPIVDESYICIILLTPNVQECLKREYHKKPNSKQKC